jgi:signal transduction histidine kinase
MSVTTPARILIVDDEPDIAVILKLHLEDCGYTTEWAGDGNAAWNMLNNNSYELALMDIRMPGMDGVELLNKIIGAGMETAVVMMTAHGNEDLAVECMKAGAYDYFSKPFSLDDMLQKVERAVTIQHTIKEKRKLEQEKEDFFFMLSHDLKNPITAVIGSIDIMREGRLGSVNSEQEEYLQSAIDSCNEVVTMIDNLLDVQRFESGRMPIAIRSCDPAEITATAVKRFIRAAEHDGIALTLNTTENMPEIAVDRTAMGRVLANLLANAVKFTPEGGSILVSCRCIENGDNHQIRIPVYVRTPDSFINRHCFVCISVKDSGDGIPAEDLGRIFERYTQSKNAAVYEKGGAGLGLAFCKMAVDSFNGIIWAESVAGSGSEFIILLPCYPGDKSRCSKQSREISA